MPADRPESIPLKERGVTKEGLGGVGTVVWGGCFDTQYFGDPGRGCDLYSHETDARTYH